MSVVIDSKLRILPGIKSYCRFIDDIGCAVSSLQLTLVPWDALVAEKKPALLAYLKPNKALGRPITREEVVVPNPRSCCGFALKVGEETFPLACPYGIQRSLLNTQVLVNTRKPEGKQVLLQALCVACISYNNNLRGNPTNNPKVFQILPNEN